MIKNKPNKEVKMGIEDRIMPSMEGESNFSLEEQKKLENLKVLLSGTSPEKFHNVLVSFAERGFYLVPESREKRYDHEIDEDKLIRDLDEAVNEEISAILSQEGLESLEDLQKFLVQKSPEEFHDFLISFAEKGFYVAPESQERRYDHEIDEVELKKDLGNVVNEKVSEILAQQL